MPLLDNFEGWLDKMIGVAQGAADKNQKRRMEQIRYKYDKQYGTAATPHGPLYKGVEATQAGETTRVGMQQTGETKRQNIVTGENQRQFNALNPPGYLEARGKVKTADLLAPGRERAFETNVVDVTRGNEKISGARDVLNKHMIATSTYGKAAIPNLWDFISMKKGSSPISAERGDYALAQKGLTRRNILSPEQLNVMTTELKNMALERQKKKAIYPED